MVLGRNLFNHDLFELSMFGKIQYAPILIRKSRIDQSAYWEKPILVNLNWKPRNQKWKFFRFP